MSWGPLFRMHFRLYTYGTLTLEIVIIKVGTTRKIVKTIFKEEYMFSYAMSGESLSWVFSNFFKKIQNHQNAPIQVLI